MSSAERILDANLNRATEGLRVVEEFLRFELGDAHLAGGYKQLRHQLSELLRPLADSLLPARDSVGDVGRELTTTTESQRVDTRHVAAASQARVEQALRCLEEYLKATKFTDRAGPVEQLRYRSYTLGRAWQTTVAAQERLANRAIYVLLPGGKSLAEFSELADRVVRGGADVVQLRDKQLGDRELLSRGRRLRELIREAEADCLFMMNDRPDLAVLCDADGVHVGQDELPVHEARRIVGASQLVGVSTHSLEQARAAVLDGADYIGCGPVFPSRTKAFANYVGPELLEAVAREISLPAFAIGGITEDRVAAIRQAGFRRVAVGDAVAGVDDPRAALDALRSALS